MLCLRFSVCGWVDNFVNDNCSSFFLARSRSLPTQHCAVLPPSLMCVLGSPTTAHSLWISAQIEHQCNHAYFSNPRFSLFPRTEAPYDAVNQPRLIFLFSLSFFGTAVSQRPNKTQETLPTLTCESSFCPMSLSSIAENYRMDKLNGVEISFLKCERFYRSKPAAYIFIHFQYKLCTHWSTS